MSETKIHLSKFETEIILNQEWILAKRSVVEKVVLLFSMLMEDYKKIIAVKNLPPGIDVENINGKISKGENYRGLPYVMMDYPAAFQKDNILAIRTFFWWGNFFSITLHLSGAWLHKMNFDTALPFLREKQFFSCINEDEWDHSFEKNNVVETKDLSKSQVVAMQKKKFFKASTKTGLDKWNDADKFLSISFGQIVDLIGISFQSGATSL